jgi:hypothetical protein
VGGGFIIEGGGGLLEVGVPCKGKKALSSNEGSSESILSVCLVQLNIDKNICGFFIHKKW